MKLSPPLLTFALALLLGLTPSTSIPAAESANFVRTDGVVYGQRGDRELTMDIVQPAEPNGIAVAAMVSGGWRSQPPGQAPILMMKPLLDAGYTVFAVCHISQPDATVMEIIADVHRGIRFIRHHAEKYGIDPDRIGVTGGSAGGHLSLMLATTGGPGPQDAADPIDRESSAVQAVAIFYPATDLVHMGESTANAGDGGPPKGYESAFHLEPGDQEGWAKIAQQVSPIYHIKSGLPPTLIYHGDADTLTPLDQSQRYQVKAQEWNNTVKLVVKPGVGHGWLTQLADLKQFAAWFDQHLLATAPAVETAPAPAAEAATP